MQYSIKHNKYYMPIRATDACANVVNQALDDFENRLNILETSNKNEYQEIMELKRELKNEYQEIMELKRELKNELTSQKQIKLKKLVGEI